MPSLEKETISYLDILIKEHDNVMDGAKALCKICGVKPDFISENTSFEDAEIEITNRRALKLEGRLVEEYVAAYKSDDPGKALEVLRSKWRVE